MKRGFHPSTSGEAGVPTSASFHIRRKALGAAIVVALLSACAGEPEAPPRLLYTFKGSIMGTTYSVKVVEPPERELDADAQEELMAVIEARLQEVDRLMSTYRDDSELSRLNAAQSTEPFPVSPATALVFDAALELGRLTDGALDVTVGPLVNAWGFGPGGFGSGGYDRESTEAPILEDEQLEELRARVGLEHLRVDAQDPNGHTVTKAIPDLYVDLSSLAKGFAVDRVHEALLERGHGHVMVEVGGEVRASGTNLQNELWRLGIERPSSLPGSGGVQRIVGLQDRALATSGDYRNYRERNGVRLSHIIDPRTGRPVDHRLASVSVVHETCMEADALATALLVLGPEEGMALAEREGLAALFLVRDGDGFQEQPSRAFREQHMPAGAETP